MSGFINNSVSGPCIYCGKTGGYCTSSGGHMFAKTTVTPNAGQMYVQVECPNCSRLLAEVASLREKVEKYEYALRNCRLMASREFHKTKGESWDHVLRFCRDAGIEGSILREQEQG